MMKCTTKERCKQMIKLNDENGNELSIKCGLKEGHDEKHHACVQW